MEMSPSSGKVPVGAQALSRAPLPWLDFATTSVPDNHELILWWAQYLWLSDGNYRQAFQRVADHFITVLEFPDVEMDEESEYKDLFDDHLNYRMLLKDVANNFLCYGNVFVSIYLPFIRTLACQQCKFEQPIRKMRGQYTVDFAPTGVRWLRKRTCPACGNSAPYQCKDRKDPDISRVQLTVHSPFDIQLSQNAYSKRKEIFWKMPQTRKRDILSKAPIHIEDTPMTYLEAVAKNADVLLDEEIVYHLAEPAIAGLETNGWGVPRAISNFRTAWLMQTINRADQAIADDYTLGMRIFSPAPQSGGGQDPMVVEGMDEFVTRTKRMIDTHRKNPATYHTAPYPLQYQFAGGEGENLLPPDKLKFRHQEFLNQLGIPLEYHQMNLSVQAAPMALRLFEQSWQAIPALYNQVLSWIVKVTARNFGLEETTVSMQRTTIADDAERKQILTQLMSANQISPQTALEPFGLDAKNEVERVFKHQEFVAKKQREADEKAQQDQEMGAVTQLAGAPTASTLAQGAANGAQVAGGMGGMPGMPQAGGDGGGSTTLKGMSDQAEQIAGQLASMPEYDRKQQLKSLRENNQDLHSLVTSALEKIRSQAASQGKQQLLSPQPGGGTPGAR